MTDIAQSLSAPARRIVLPRLYLRHLSSLEGLLPWLVPAILLALWQAGFSLGLIHA